MKPNEGRMKVRKRRKRGRKENIPKHTCRMMAGITDILLMEENRIFNSPYKPEEQSRNVSLLIQNKCFILIIALSKYKLIGRII